jgi:XTP/dITP diphosphohydrolase
MNRTAFVIASTNPGKLREFEEILEGSPFQFCLPSALGIALEVVENGRTYAENAALKARAYALASGRVALADDSGLEVDALGGQPGLYSARYSAKPGATDADRRAYLLENLRDKPRPWHAHFHCTVAVATPLGEVFFADGDCSGEIIPQERGSNGFGYDPVFLLPQRGLTMAELSSAEKNQMSHRALAVKAALPMLLRLTVE